MPRARGYRRRALALAFGTLAAVVAAEGLARGLGYHGLADPRVFQYDAEIGWTLIPNRHEWHSALDFGVWITTDADGLRAGARPADSPAHPMRPTVLVLGDSFAFGWGVRGDQSFPTVLEGELANTRAPYRIRTAGVPGYSTDQEYLLWRRLAAVVRPKVVLLLFHPSDFSGNVQASQVMGRNIYFKPRFQLADGTPHLAGVPVPDKREWIPSGVTEPLRRWLRPFANYAIAQAAVQRFRGRQTNLAAASTPRPPELTPDALAVTAALIAALNRDVRATGADVLVALTPSDGATAQRLGDICRTQSIPFIDLQPAFSGQRDVLLPFDKHWNAHGHAIAARAVAAVLRKP